MKTCRMLFLLVMLSCCLGCQKKPTEPVNDNLFDPEYDWGDSVSPVAAFTISTKDSMTYLFDASQSSDLDCDHSRLLYRWDWEGEELWEIGWTKTPAAQYTFQNGEDHATVLQVKGAQGLVGTKKIITRGYSRYYIVVNTMLYMPAGEFSMGDKSGLPNEKPAHLVFLDGYCIDQNPVSNDEYVDFLNAVAGSIQVSDSTVFYDGKKILAVKKGQPITYDGRTFSVPGGQSSNPVLYVSWYGARAYASFNRCRLPTEAEWEKAALAHFPKKFGVRNPEWCGDWYDSFYYSISPAVNPQGPAAGDKKVIRGWYPTQSWALYSRSGSPPDLLYPYTFRCAF
jgi:hypothetical protein